MKEETLDCDICGQESAQIRHMTRSYGKGADLLIIENVPVVVCLHCGESYLTAETLHEIERIKMHPAQPGETEERGRSQFRLESDSGTFSLAITPS